jgi:Concanavalin A-like lectin/glucanases superfamily
LIKGQAVKLDGIDDWVLVNNSSSFPTTEISISYWLKQDNLPSYLSNYISKEMAFQSYLYSTGVLQSGLWKGSGGYWSGYSSGNYKYDVTKWVLYTWTFSNVTKKSKTFINGNLVDEITESDANAYLRTSSQPMYIGRNGSANVHHVNGLIDETRIYNRALTAAEVGALYQQGTTNQTYCSLAKDSAFLDKNNTLALAKLIAIDGSQAVLFPKSVDAVITYKNFVSKTGTLKNTASALTKQIGQLKNQRNLLTSQTYGRVSNSKSVYQKTLRAKKLNQEINLLSRDKVLAKAGYDNIAVKMKAEPSLLQQKVAHASAVLNVYSLAISSYELYKDAQSIYEGKHLGL